MLRVWFNGRTCPSQGQDTGSIPVTRSSPAPYADVAQLVEQLFRKQ